MSEPPSAQQRTWQPLGDRLTGLVGVSLQLWRENRLKFFGIGFLVLSIMMCGLNPLMDSDVGIVNFVGGLCLLLWLGFLLGFVITGATRGWRWLDERTELDSRKGKLRSKWDSVNGDAEWIVFFDDGGFLRGDGFSAKYEFDPKADIITIRAMQLDEVIPVQVVSLSNHELVLATEGLTLHDRKGKSITDVERQKALEEYSRKWGERAKTAAAVVGTAVGVAALGVLVLGGAAAAAGSVGTSGGITPSGSKVCWNCSHYFDARRPTCSNCGVVNR